MNHIWVVEMWMDSLKRPKWAPTVGAALSRSDAQGVIEDWRKRNPCDKFRVRPYVCGAATQAHKEE